MKRILLAVLFVFALCSITFAGWVNGYYRSNGTWVNGYYRTDPDQYKWNNYGPAEPNNTLERYYPQTRDNDNDGIVNQYDMDDDNDGILDDYDNNQYGR